MFRMNLNKKKQQKHFMIGSLLYRTQVLQWYCNTVRLTNAQILAFWSGFILVCVGCEDSGANSWADADIDRKSQNKREKFFLNLHFFRKNNFTLVSTYIFPNTDHSPCFPLGSFLLIHNFFKVLCIFYWERLLFLHLTKAFSHFFCYNMKLVAHFQLFSLRSLVLNWSFSSQPFSCVSLIQLVCCCRPISRLSSLITNDWPKCFWGHD